MLGIFLKARGIAFDQVMAPLIQVVLLTALVLAGMVSPWDPWGHFENRGYDFWVDRFHHAEEQPIAIVAIDETSIRQFGDWPWPRSRIADLVNLISEQGADALGICILYTQPDQSPGLIEIRELKTRLHNLQVKGDGPSSSAKKVYSARPKRG